MVEVAAQGKTNVVIRATLESRIVAALYTGITKMTFAGTAITQPSSWAFWGGLQASEVLQVRWHDTLWNEGKIRFPKRWAGADREPKLFIERIRSTASGL